MAVSVADWPLLERDPVTGVGVARPALDIRPFTGGLFHDFSTGAPGVTILGKERPCPSFIDSTTIGTTGVLVYADPVEVPLTGIPMWAKLTCSSSSSQKLTFADASYPNSAIGCGRVYLYFPLNITQTRFVIINTVAVDGSTGQSIYLRLDTARTISVIDGPGTVRGTSAFSLVAGTAYRVELRVVLTAAGMATVTVWVYQGHSLTPLGSFTTSSFAAGALARSAEFGNVSGANLAGKLLYVGAIGAACDAPPGAYVREELATRLLAVDGVKRYELGPNGDLVVRANRDYHISDGGTDIYLVQRGDVVARIGNDGIYVGPNTGVGDPGGIGDDDLRDITMDTKNRRLAARSFNLANLRDPPDVAYMKQELVDDPNNTGYGKAGTGASLTACSSTATFTDLTLIMQNRGHGIRINGVSYNIAEIIGPNSCTLKPVPQATGSGLTWKLKTFPYPTRDQMRGINSGATLGQLGRMLPMAHAPIASGSNGVSTTSGSPVVAISALSAGNKAFWTVGRRVLINDDPALMISSPGRTFHIVSVAGDGNSVTLDSNVPQTLSNVKWKLAGADTDGFAIKALNNLATLKADARADIVNWSTKLSTGSCDWTITAILLDALWNQDTSQQVDIWKVKAEGGMELLQGEGFLKALQVLSRGTLGYENGQGAGGLVTQGSGSGKATAVTLNKATGKITLNNAALAAGAVVSFTLTNSQILSINDAIVVNLIAGYTGNGIYRAWAERAAVGSCVICLQNIDSSSHSDAVVLQVNVYRGAQA